MTEKAKYAAEWAVYFLGVEARCSLHGGWGRLHLKIGDWNTRPIEDALKQRVKVLEEALKWCGEHAYAGGKRFRDIEPVKSALAPPVGEKEKNERD